MLVPIDTLPGSSKIWIYQSSEPFSDAVAESLMKSAEEFAGKWTAHDASLKAGVDVRYNTFIIFAVDESHNGASGCSLDKKVRFVKEMEAAYGLNFFDRMRISWKNDTQVHVAPYSVFGELKQKGTVNDQTIVFNNLVSTLDEYRANWEVPLSLSWHRNLLQPA